MLAYMRVYADILEKIKNGTYPIGSFIPPESELEKIYEVSRTSVRRAIQELVKDNWVYVKQGRGTEVVMQRRPVEDSVYRISSTAKIIEKLYGSERPLHSPMSVDVVPASKKLADFFGDAAKEDLYRVRRVLDFADGTRMGYKKSYLPVRDLLALEEYNNVSLNIYSLLLNQYGIKIDNCYETVTAVPADFEDSHVLKVKLNEPLLLFTRYSFTSDKPIEYCEFKIVPECYELGFRMEAPLP